MVTSRTTHTARPDPNGETEPANQLRRPLISSGYSISTIRCSSSAVVIQPPKRSAVSCGKISHTVRPISSKVGILPRVHGSALFTRGETQAIVAVTLGTARDGQVIDAVAGEYKEHFLFHYNFPPYSVGEAGRMMGPKRREIGHGRLAKRGVLAVMPTMEEFPYTIRVVSEITESNGSSSMASVCGSSLALMDAGVPIKAPVAGIAMGLVKEGDEFVVLSDILGDEDHLGDMDFKVAGTDQGITALQMDIKIRGIVTGVDALAVAVRYPHPSHVHHRHHQHGPGQASQHPSYA